MTLYVGEQLRIVFSGKEYDKRTPLTDENVNGASVLILDCDSSVLVSDGVMTWDEDESLWEYKWDTTGLTAGTYRYRVTALGADNKPSVEWGRVRLARQPTIAT